MNMVSHTSDCVLRLVYPYRECMVLFIKEPNLL